MKNIELRMSGMLKEKLKFNIRINEMNTLFFEKIPKIVKSLANFNKR